MCNQWISVAFMSIIGEPIIHCWREVKLQWERDIGKHLPQEQWGTIMQHINYLSKCVNKQMKILDRIYLIPQKLNEVNPHMSDLCWHWLR